MTETQIESSMQNNERITSLMTDLKATLDLYYDKSESESTSNNNY